LAAAAPCQREVERTLKKHHVVRAKGGAVSIVAWVAMMGGKSGEGESDKNRVHVRASEMTTPPIACSAAAKRMRYHRERRREGLRCVTIELRETEVTELIERGLMDADARNDVHAIRNAVHRHLDESLIART
jgi:hypothetical protein